MTLHGFLLAMLAGLLTTECTEWAPWLAVRLMRWAAKHRYTDQDRAAVRAEELQALIADRPSRLFKLFTSLGFAAAAIVAISGRRFRLLLGIGRRVSRGIQRLIPVEIAGPAVAAGISTATPGFLSGHPFEAIVIGLASVLAMGGLTATIYFAFVLSDKQKESEHRTRDR